MEPTEPGNKSVAVLVNFSDEDQTLDLSGVSFFPPEAVVVVRSGSATNPATEPGWALKSVNKQK